MEERINNCKIAVIMPCYNYAHYIAEAIGSLKSQSYKDFVCLIVNDGSTDNSEEVIMREISGDGRFVYVRTENGGLSRARNFGMSQTDSKYVLFFDPDDKLSPSYIENAVRFLERHPDFDVYYGNAEFFFDDGTSIPWNLPPYSYGNLLNGNMIYSACIYRRSMYERAGGYDESMDAYEDWEFLIRALNGGRKVYRSDDTVFFYRRHDGSMDSRARDSFAEYYRYIYKKNKDIFDENNILLTDENESEE